MSADRNPPADDLLRVAESVVHDLGNLLAVIAGHTSMLEPLVRADAEGRESIAEIRRAVTGSIARLHELAAAIRHTTAEPPLMGQPVALLVEPDADAAERVGTFLKRGGYQVVSMAGIEEARARSSDLTVDLAIVSASPGDPSAIALIDDLRTRQPRLPALILSATASPASPAPPAAPTEWLTTPLAMDELARAVGRLVQEP
jgi:CheY-like chemotaxis protein